MLHRESSLLCATRSGHRLFSAYMVCATAGDTEPAGLASGMLCRSNSTALCCYFSMCRTDLRARVRESKSVSEFYSSGIAFCLRQAFLGLARIQLFFILHCLRQVIHTGFCYGLLKTKYLKSKQNLSTD